MAHGCPQCLLALLRLFLLPAMPFPKPLSACPPRPSGHTISSDCFRSGSAGLAHAALTPKLLAPREKCFPHVLPSTPLGTLLRLVTAPRLRRKSCPGRWEMWVLAPCNLPHLTFLVNENNVFLSASPTDGDLRSTGTFNPEHRSQRD